MINWHSQTSYLIYIGNTLFSWSSRKQDTVAQFSRESEYCAIVLMVQELEWICSVLTILGEEPPW